MNIESPVRRVAANYADEIAGLLRRLDMDAFERVFGHLRSVRRARSTIFLAGNGGSAATASHWANDLGKATKGPAAPPVRVNSLTEHVSWLTALANDEGYDRVFAGQIENLARPGDLLVVLSVSGGSANLVEAVRTARAHGALTIGILGSDGGRLKDLVDDRLLVATAADSYGPAEDAHSIVCHMLTACLAIDAASGQAQGAETHN
jgi:D-sedoheptulose 7-phosphate isomerase